MISSRDILGVLAILATPNWATCKISQSV